MMEKMKTLVKKTYLPLFNDSDVIDMTLPLSKQGGRPYTDASHPWPECSECHRKYILFIQIDRNTLPAPYTSSGLFQLFMHSLSFLECLFSNACGDNTFIRIIEQTNILENDSSKYTNVDENRILPEWIIEAWVPRVELPNCYYLPKRVSALESEISFADFKQFFEERCQYLFKDLVLLVGSIMPLFSQIPKDIPEHSEDDENYDSPDDEETLENRVKLSQQFQAREKTKLGGWPSWIDCSSYKCESAGFDKELYLQIIWQRFANQLFYSHNDPDKILFLKDL